MGERHADSPTSQTLSKLQGCQAQIETAIDCFLCGDYASAMTLAAAAEGMFSSRKGGGVVDRMTTRLKALDNDLRWIDFLNMEVHFLKHETPQIPEPIVIDDGDVAFMLVRAMSKLEPDEWTPKMAAAKAVILAAIVP